ncbi:Mov34/MPN/PAD-1 family protein [Vreelandella sp. EE22]
MSLRYTLPHSDETILFPRQTLLHLERYQQRFRWQPEAGGPLFVRTFGKEHVVEKAGGPFALDHRYRFGFIPHHPSAQACIDEQRQLGRHYVGSWHTHPELTPRPSKVDLQTMSELFQRSTHSLNAFVFVIVGTGKLTSSLYTCLWTGDAVLPLS